MTDRRTGKDLKDIPILEEPQLRIYVFLNEEGKIKIGKTKNIYQRYLSLCGSNSRGVKLTDCMVTPSTYLYTLESHMHDKFARYRIPNTEWFFDKEDPTGKKLFENACKELKLLFSSNDYKKCYELRKSMCQKVGDCNDN